MREFLRTFLIEPFKDRSWFGYLVGSFMWLLTIGIVIGMMWVCVWAIDSSFLPIKEKEGKVTGHWYVPEYTTTTYIVSNNVMIPITNYFDASYGINVEINGITGCVCLCKSSWDTIKVGDKFCFKYTKGRIRKTIYIKSFCGEKD